MNISQLQHNQTNRTHLGSTVLSHVSEPGQDAVAFVRRELLQLQGLLRHEVHGRLEVRFPQLKRETN